MRWYLELYSYLKTVSAKQWLLCVAMPLLKDAP